MMAIGFAGLGFLGLRGTQNGDGVKPRGPFLRALSAVVASARQTGP